MSGCEPDEARPLIKESGGLFIGGAGGSIPRYVGLHRLMRDMLLFELFIRFGGDLLSHTLRCSTIGAKALNGRVRDGSGCFALAMTTKPNKKF